jgi:CubicO group peptidase (beta-lactamase class C family)
MRRGVLMVLSVALALAAWAGLVMIGTLDGWARTRIAPPDDIRAFANAATQRIVTESKGNVAFNLIKGGRVDHQHYQSVGRAVDQDTLFQVASLSKWVTAWGVMTLVESGRIDLDVPVSRYLTRWALPPSAFNNDDVTVRRLLSHTAGFVDGLGYAGFAPGTEIQSLEASLTRAADASPGKDGAVRVGTAPGSEWIYSGGGYTLLQLIIEEVSGEPFNAYMKRVVFMPLGMSRSTFELSEDQDENVAEVFNTDGSPATLFQFTAKAATALYTSAGDLSRFVQAHLSGPSGEPLGRGVLRPETLAEMRRPHAFQLGAEIWGLGTILYAPNNSGGFIIGHDGSNEPAINTAARLDPASGDGIILLETGNDLLATQIAGDWVFWRTGNVDLLDVTAQIPQALSNLIAGALLIVAVGLFAAWRLTHKAI